MSKAGETFFTSVGCMDGRVHQAILLYGQKRYGVKFADTITEAGLVGQLARLQTPERSDGGQAQIKLKECNSDECCGGNCADKKEKDCCSESLLDSIKKKIMISLEKHYSKGIIVHGHQDCAGNPVEDKKHKEDVLKTCEIIKSIVPQETEIKPVFVVRKGKNWEVEEL